MGCKFERDICFFSFNCLAISIFNISLESYSWTLHFDTRIKTTPTVKRMRNQDRNRDFLVTDLSSDSSDVLFVTSETRK